MALIECRSAQPGIPSRWVEVEHINDDEVTQAQRRLEEHLASHQQISTAVALALIEVTTTCPSANPSDLWQHVIYRHLLNLGWSDQRWKRVAGFALERAIEAIYKPRLAKHNIRMRILASQEANRLLTSRDIGDITGTKIDLFIEGHLEGNWVLFGVAHVKSSIAERIQDDVPASLAFMQRGLTSIAITMDAKSFPPPHGDCVNYGEFGGRSLGVEKDRQKRAYIEETGQFDGLFSFNLRTPPSQSITISGKRIYSMGMQEKQPDQLVRFLRERWDVYSSAT